MIQLALLLMGREFVHRYRGVLAGIGFLWLALGIATVIDGLDGALYFPLHIFGWLLLAQGLINFLLIPRVFNRPLVRATRWFQSIVFVLTALLIITPNRESGFVMAMLFGTLFLVDGILRIASALVVRFAAWRMAVAAGVAQILLAILIYEPYPTHYAGTLPFCIGIWLTIAGANLLMTAWRLENTGQVKTAEASAGTPLRVVDTPPSSPDAPTRPSNELVVHVWTAVGTAENPVPPRPVVDRYLIAVDSKGVVSTGHAAVEVEPDLYISHYPKVELEHSDDELGQILLATPENNVEGLFQPSYAKESSDWCESTEKIRFKEYDHAKLRAWWDDYSRDNTYNLTNRSCSTTAVRAIETALEGIVGRQTPGWGGFFRVLFSPELWMASHLRTRGQTMAWTPGLTLDYARALRGIIHPPPVGWLEHTRLVLDVWRLSRPRRPLTPRPPLSQAKEGE